MKLLALSLSITYIVLWILSQSPYVPKMSINLIKLHLYRIRNKLFIYFYILQAPNIFFKSNLKSTITVQCVWSYVLKDWFILQTFKLPQLAMYTVPVQYQNLTGFNCITS